MPQYETHEDLIKFLNFEKNLKMHWIITFSWIMVQHMHGIILKVIKYVVRIA
jgi:hypothetical protein